MNFRLRFSLRTMVICLTLLSLALGIPIFRVRSIAKRQRNAIRSLKSLQVEAEFATDSATPPWWKREIRNWIDRDAFREVNSVRIPENAKDLDRAFALLAELVNLRQLIIQSRELADKHLEVLGKIATLKELHCSEASYTASGVRSLLSRNKFEILHVPSAKFDDQMLTMLGNSGQLIEASLDASTATPNGFANFKKCSKLKALILYRVRDVGECLRSSGVTSGLTNLSVCEAEITQDDVNEFANISKLYLLALDNCQLNGVSLEPLTQLPALRILDLRHTQLNDSQFDAIKQFKTLMVMDLHGGVTDENIEEFLQSPVIRTLSFSKTDLSDVGIQKLAGRPTFQYLFLPDDTRCTVDGIRKLQESARITVGIGNDDGSILYRPGGVVEDRRRKKTSTP